MKHSLTVAAFCIFAVAACTETFAGCMKARCDDYRDESLGHTASFVIVPQSPYEANEWMSMGEIPTYALRNPDVQYVKSTNE